MELIPFKRRKVYSKDKLRLLPHLGNRTILGRYITSTNNLADIEKLILLEIQGQNRHHILDRLYGRFFRLQRELQRKDKPESKVEKEVCAYAEKEGFITYKFTSPERPHVPDRLVLPPDGLGVFFIEFKRQGKSMREGQKREADIIRKQGYEVYEVDSVLDGKSIIDTYRYI